jgi:hypothetical protein
MVAPNPQPVQIVAAGDMPPGPGTRVTRTAGQASGAAAVVVLLVWVARLFGVDLDPDGPGTNAPAEVIAAATALLSIAAAWAMNRGKVA